MYETTERFRRAIRTSGRRKTILRVRDAFGTALLYDNVPITDGSITVDRNSDCRRVATVTVGESTLVELFKETESTPFGMEVEILNGIIYPDGDEELVRMGVFSIEGFSWTESSTVPFPVLELMDRTQAIIRANLTSSRDFSGHWAKDVIETLLRDVIPSGILVMDPELPNRRLPGGSTFDGSRWDVIRTCAEAMGAEAYFDRDGSLRVSDIKDPTAPIDAAVWEFNTGDGFDRIIGSGEGYRNFRETGILIDATRSIDRKQTYNAVAVYGAAPNGTSAQPYAIVTDNDPNSPTYYNGPFGKSIKRIDNSTLTTTTACANAAVAELQASLGFSRGLSFSAIGNPALDEGDYCLFTFLDGGQEVHLLDSFTYPLASGDFTGETRTSPSRQTTTISIKKGKTILDRKPTTPGNLKITGVTNSTVSLSWQQSIQANNPISHYIIYRGDNAATQVAAPYTSGVVTGLPSGTTYSFSVVAVDYAGIESEHSRAVTAKTTGPTGAPLNPVKYTTEFRGTWSASYDGSNNRLAKYSDLCYQGFKDDGFGDMRSLIGFDWKDIQNQLNEAFISACYITLYFKSWGVSTGGTAVIGFHNYTSQPETWADAKVFQDRVRSSGWPSPGRRAVSLGVGVGNAFKLGTYTGIALGPTPTNSGKYRGICEGTAGGSVEPVLTVVYTKEI